MTRAAPLPPDEADRLVAVRSLGLTDAARQDRFAPIARVTAALFGVPAAFVALVDADVLRFQSCVGFPPFEVRREDSFCAHTVVAGRLLVVPDLAVDERFRASPLVTQLGYRCYAGQPLRVRGHVVGTLCILDRRPRTLTEGEEALLADLARWAESELAGGADESTTLAALRQRDEVLLAAADAAVFGVDPDGYVTFANPAAARLLAEPVERVVGAHFHERFHHTRLDGTPYPWDQCPSYRALRTGERQRERREVVHRSDGTRVEVEYSGTPLVVGDDVVGVVVTLSDVTEQRAVERLKDEFVSIVSHELRTPLTSIRGSLGLLDSGRFGELPPKAARLVAIALGNTERLIGLVNDMLDLERLDAGRVEIEPVVQPLRGVFELVSADVSGAAGDAGVTLAFAGHDTVAAVDAETMARALTNLVGNAVKFSPPGSTVRVTAGDADDHVAVTVRDEGRGIPPEKIERIFERFEQVDASDAREKGGSGLGLAITRSIVERHGGRITAASEVGAWTAFTILLPGRSATGGAQVVVVEDDADLAEVLAAAIGSLGVRTTTAAAVDDAVAVIRRERPRLVVLDLTLRGGTGYEVAEQLRADPAVAATPLVVATVAQLSPADVRRLELGPTRVVEKAVHGSDVVSAVLDAVREHVLESPV